MKTKKAKQPIIYTACVNDLIYFCNKPFKDPNEVNYQRLHIFFTNEAMTGMFGSSGGRCYGVDLSEEAAIKFLAENE